MAPIGSHLSGEFLGPHLLTRAISVYTAQLDIYPMKYPETLLLRLPEGMKDRLRECGNVQAFVRRAIERELSRGAALGVPSSLERQISSQSLPEVEAPCSRGFLRKVTPEAEMSSNGRVLLTAIRKRGELSRRQAKRDFGWDEGALLKASLEIRGCVEMDAERFWCSL